MLKQIVLMATPFAQVWLFFHNCPRILFTVIIGIYYFRSSFIAFMFIFFLVILSRITCTCNSVRLPSASTPSSLLSTTQHDLLVRELSIRKELLKNRNTCSFIRFILIDTCKNLLDLQLLSQAFVRVVKAFVSSRN